MILMHLKALFVSECTVSNMSDIALTHQPTACVTPGLRPPLPAETDHQVFIQSRLE